MPLILNIDTALDTALVCLSGDGIPLHAATNAHQMDHASWILPAIAEIMSKSGKMLQDIDAVAVSNGPGSYTGLRVGLSTAKGLCYGLGKPLISIGTLELMAHAVDKNLAEYICPVIDARRMEIFTAVYDWNMQQILSPTAMIVEANSFMTILEKGRILFSGNALNKLQQVIVHHNAIFNNFPLTAECFSQLSTQRFASGKFADPAYTEPFYIKEFHSTMR